MSLKVHLFQSFTQSIQSIVTQSIFLFKHMEDENVFTFVLKLQYLYSSLTGFLSARQFTADCHSK